MSLTPSAAQPFLSPCGRAPTKERNLFLQLLKSRDSLSRNSPRDHGFASCTDACPLLCFVGNTDAHSRNHREWWILDSVLHQHGLPWMKLSMASELQMCCQVSAAMINQLQLLFRYIHVSLGHQHQKHERTPSAHGQRYFIVRDEVKHNKGRARDLGRIRVLFPDFICGLKWIASFLPCMTGILFSITLISLGKSLWQCAGI